MNPLAYAGAGLLGGTIRVAKKLHGGDLSNLVHVEFEDGREAVFKSGPAPRTEASMLQVIQAARVPAPDVLAVNDEVLALSFVAGNGRVGNAWPALGSTLARLHHITGPRYGWPKNYAFGHVAIDNAWADAWPTFYGERRLMVHLPRIPLDLAKRVERLAKDLDRRLPSRPPAALLHGDLWGGNVLVDGECIAAFIDPACVYGHAEMDIAMLGLFDSPGPGFFDTYGQLEQGFDARLTIYRLWPALVHLRLFGKTYRRMVEGLLSAAGV
jgi:fructosamine-3-kinase